MRRAGHRDHRRAHGAAAALVVLAIEESYATLNDGLPGGARTLLREYVDRGDLGVKTGRGLYDDYAPGA